MVPLGDEAQVEACFVHLERVLMLSHDRCTVCVKRIIGSIIDLDAHDRNPR